MKKIIALSLLFCLPNLGICDDDDYKHHRGHQGKIISHQEAAQRARNAVGGGKVEDVDFENDYGRPVYKVEIERRDRDFEVIIDARNGKILRIKRD